MTTNLDLEKYCKSLQVKLNGVFNKDDLPFLKHRKDGLYILNSENLLEGSGVHWVGLVILGKQSCYFDSFGGEYPYRQVKEFSTNRLIYNNQRLQDLTSVRCGEFCVYFGYCLLNKYKKIKGLHNRLKLFLNEFYKENYKKNDDILKEKFSSLNINI